MALPLQYETHYYWSGDGINGDLEVDERPAIPVGAPIDTRVFNPEHLLLAAAEICLANTFMKLAETARLEVISYHSHAFGELEFVAREGYRFHDILVKPIIKVAEEDIEQTRMTLDRAHDACLIARSLNFDVRIEANIQPTVTAATAMLS